MIYLIQSTEVDSQPEYVALDEQKALQAVDVINSTLGKYDRPYEVRALPVVDDPNDLNKRYVYRAWLNSAGLPDRDGTVTLSRILPSQAQRGAAKASNGTWMGFSTHSYEDAVNEARSALALATDG